MIVPLVCGMGAVLILAYDHFSRVNGFTLALPA